MARQKEFDRDDALDEAVKVFASHGYEGASTDALLSHMGISRQSMYDTFGDKRQLYLFVTQ
jgi:TetR/AcrR family transcriptional repressor of nem operon